MTVSILFSSRCFLAIIKGDPSNPTESIVRRWLRGIHESTGIQVHYSPVIHQMLVNKAKYINATSRRLIGYVDKINCIVYTATSYTVKKMYNYNACTQM